MKSLQGDLQRISLCITSSMSEISEFKSNEGKFALKKMRSDTLVQKRETYPEYFKSTKLGGQVREINFRLSNMMSDTSQCAVQAIGFDRRGVYVFCI